MCLTIKLRQEAQIAQEDIKCFKVLIKSNEWCTPYQYDDVIPGEIKTSDIETKDLSEFIEIHKALHSFTNLTAAKREKAWHCERSRESKIVNCIIPKGSIYYIGKFEYLKDSFASNKLVYPETF